MVAEEIDPVKSVKSAQEIRLTGTLAQASLTNIKKEPLLAVQSQKMTQTLLLGLIR